MKEAETHTSYRRKKVMEDLLHGEPNLCLPNFHKTTHPYSFFVLTFLIIRVEASPYQFKERTHTKKNK